MPPHHHQAALPVRWRVPVQSHDDWAVLRIFRTPSGERTAVAFTSEALLAEVLGEGQASTTLSESRLRELIAPLGISLITVNPTLTVPQRDLRNRGAQSAQAAHRRPRRFDHDHVAA